MKITIPCESAEEMMQIHKKFSTLDGFKSHNHETVQPKGIPPRVHLEFPNESESTFIEILKEFNLDYKILSERFTKFIESWH